MAGLLGLAAASAGDAAVGWTGPTLVGRAAECENVTAAIDPAGVDHVVSECGGRLRYNTNRTGHWTTTYLSVPLAFADLDPQLAIDGGRVYVAFNRVQFLACGIDYVADDYRWRSLAGTTWSSPVRFGLAGDRMQSFRVVGGRVHATVTQQLDGRVVYETTASGALRRYPITDAIGVASLGVGSDGRARVAYEAAHSLRYAIFTGSGFSKVTIPGTTADDRAPVLTLDATNHAHVVWTRAGEEGCAAGGPGPGKGTLYATNAGGTWTPVDQRQVTTRTGFASLTLDTVTKELDVAVGGEQGLYAYTNAGGGWTETKLSSAPVASLAIRLDHAHNRLLTVFDRESGESTSASVFAFTRP